MIHVEQSNIASFSGFARLLGVKPSYVTKLKDQGRLVLTEDGKRVLVAESKGLIKQTEGRRQDVAARHKQGRDETAAQAPEGEGAEAGDSAVETVDKLLHALTSPRIEDVLRAAPMAANVVKAISEARRVRALADQEEMNRDQQAGALLAREDVDFVLNDFGATLRGLCENLADRLAPQVYPLITLEETHAAISEAAEDLQREMAETMRRRIEGLTNNTGGK